MKKKTLLWIIISIVVLIIVIIVLGNNKKEELVSVTAELPVRKTITESIPANGKIQPVVEVKISPDVSGEIVELYIKEGDHVKKGELLLKIKQDYYISGRDRAAAQLNSVKSQLLQSEAQFAQTELAFNRSQKLYNERVVSEADFETAQMQYNVHKRQVESAEFNVKSAEATLKEAEENLIKTTIYAPMDGVVSKLSVERGERVVGTSQMAGTEMLRIANLNAMEVLVDVNENDIVRVKLQDTTVIEVDAYPARKFKGIVTQIANSSKTAGAATSADQVTNFEVKIFILPESYNDLLTASTLNPFRPGMSAAVYIQTETRENILAVPIQCVTTRTDLGVADTTKKETVVAELESTDMYVERVFVVQPDQTVKSVVITTGIQDNTHIEVKSGLSDSLNVVNGPYNAISKRLKEDTKVRITSNSTRK